MSPPLNNNPNNNNRDHSMTCRPSAAGKNEWSCEKRSVKRVDAKLHVEQNLAVFAHPDTYGYLTSARQTTPYTAGDYKQSCTHFLFSNGGLFSPFLEALV